MQADAGAYDGGGFRIYDVSGSYPAQAGPFRENRWSGVHRFDMDERYAYISTEMEGYVGNILVIYDIRNPAKPQEVSRWWMPGQHVAGGEKPPWPGSATACTTRCASATCCGPAAGTRGCA